MPEDVGGDEIDAGGPTINAAFFASGAIGLFKINGVDCTSAVIKAEVQRTNGYACGFISITVPQTLVVSSPGHRVEYWSKTAAGTSYKEFDGYVDANNPQGTAVEIFAYDMLHKAIELQATNKTYDSVVDTQAGVISAIFKDLITQAGLNYDGSGTTVQSTSAYGLATLGKFVCNETNIFDAMVRLATIANWQFYYRADTNQVYFEPKGYTQNATPLTVGSSTGGITNVPSWNKDVTELVNVLTIKGAVATSTPTAEIKSGDGVTTVFNLAQRPSTFLQVETPVGTVKIPGVPNSGSAYDYYLNDYVTMDGTHIPQIVFTSAPANSANNIKITYAYDIPQTVTINGPDSSRAAPPTGYGDRKKTITLTDTLSVNDAYAYGNAYVSAFSQPFLTASFKYYTATPSYYVGQTIVVTDSINGFTNQSLVINKQVISYPSPVDQITAGQKDWKLADLNADQARRIALLEALVSGQTGSNYLGQSVGANISFSRYQLVVQIRSLNTSGSFNISSFNSTSVYNDQSTVDSTTTYNY